MPVFHPNCRCTIRPVFDESVMAKLEQLHGKRKTEGTALERVKKMTYSEWQAKYAKEGTDEARKAFRAENAKPMATKQTPTPAESVQGPQRIKAPLGTTAEDNTALKPFGLDADSARALRSADSLKGVSVVAVIDGGKGYGYAIVDRPRVGRQAYYGKISIIEQAQEAPKPVPERGTPATIKETPKVEPSKARDEPMKRGPIEQDGYTLTGKRTVKDKGKDVTVYEIATPQGRTMTAAFEQTSKGLRMLTVGSNGNVIRNKVSEDEGYIKAMRSLIDRAENPASEPTEYTPPEPLVRPKEVEIPKKPEERLVIQANAAEVEWRDVKPLEEPLDDTDILKKVAAGDGTKGSCVSQTMSRIGNSMGYDVNDLRGGKSCDFFAEDGTARQITDAAEGFTETGKDDYAMWDAIKKNIREGQEYVIWLGGHCATVRKVGRAYEYLELQAEMGNGWKAMDPTLLKKRFKCAKTSRWTHPTFLASVDSIKSSGIIPYLLGYLNR